MWLVAGLGNPGAKYAAHRHNAGFMLADALAESYRFSPWSQKFAGLLCEGVIAGEKIVLLKPQTYMNRSGQSVGECARFYKIEADHVVVLHDELDLPVGKLRIKRGGGHGGHNGLRDIDAHLGKDYWRFRLGIDHPGDKDRVTDYVLGDFAKNELEPMKKLFEDVVRHLPIFFEAGHEALMSKIALDSPSKNSTTKPTTQEAR